MSPTSKERMIEQINTAIKRKGLSVPQAAKKVGITTTQMEGILEGHTICDVNRLTQIRQKIIKG